MNRILLVEDNSSIKMGLEFLLKSEGYEAAFAEDKVQAQKLIDNQSFDLVLLDVSLPDGNGFDLCKHIKRDTDTPVIFLTAKDEEKDVVLGFDLGADDYIIKPFRNRELLSRIKNVLRRNGKEAKLFCHGITIDTVSGKVSRGGTDISLTKLEYQILLTMFSNPNKLFTREEILSNIWDMAGNFVNDNTLTVSIKRLREKIGDTDAHIIETVRGTGYRIGATK